MRYDVAIVGAGPAGSWLARELAKNNISVALFERSAVAGEPNFSSAGSPLYTAERFNLPPEAIAAKWDAIRIVGPNSGQEWQFKKPVGAVFDFRKLKSMLTDEARSYGAKVILGTAVESAEQKGSYAFIHTKPQQDEYLAKIVVDASGPGGVLATQIGLRRKILSLPSTGLEIIVNAKLALDKEFSTMTFYYGSTWVPHGYGWIFPMQTPFLKIGAGVAQPARYHPVINLDNILNNLIERIPWAKNSEIVEKHGGSVWGTGGIKNHVQGNIIAIGDAADQINPLGGEGIRHVLQSSLLASRVIIDALKENNIKALYRYNNLWKSYVGWKWRVCHKIADIVYPNFSYRRWDQLTQLLSKISAEEVFDILFEYKAGPVVRALFRKQIF